MRLTRSSSAVIIGRTFIDPTIDFTGAQDGDALIRSGGRYTNAADGKFGDGSDGAITVSGAIGPRTRDYYYSDGTYVAGAADQWGRSLMCFLGTLDIISASSGAILCDGDAGNNAAANVAGTAISAASGSSCSMIGSPAGGAGATNAGAAGGVTTVTAAFAGGPGGAAGTAGTGLAGANAAGAPGVSNLIGRYIVPRHDQLITASFGGTPSAGGASGGGDGTATSSGAGASGAVGGPLQQCFARRVARSAANANTGVIRCRGGNGGNGGSPAAGNRGAGCASAGAGGGCFRLVCDALVGSTHINCVDVSGGNAGNNGTPTGTGTSGTAPSAGFGGRLVVWCRTASPMCTVTDKTAVGGNAGSGATGGVATQALCNL